MKFHFFQFIVLIYSLWSSATAQDQANTGPSFDLMPREKYYLYIKAGDPASIRCPVLNKGIYDISFSKTSGPESPKSITIGDTIQANEDRRYELITEKLGKTVGAAIISTLTINQVMWNDNGTYLCQVNTDVPKKLEFYLQVLMSPQIVDTNTTKVYFAEVNDHVTLKCNAFGNPKPQIRWMRSDFQPLPNGQIIYKSVGSEGKFEILKVKSEDRGTYVCIAANDLDEGERKHVNLFVKYPPIVEALKTEVGQMQGQDLDAYLECVVRAYPPATVTWTHNDAKNNQEFEIISDDRHIIEDSGSIFLTGDDFIRYRLTVKYVRSNDFGNYYCKAANIYGKRSVQIRLFETLEKQFLFPPMDQQQSQDLMRDLGIMK